MEYRNAKLIKIDRNGSKHYEGMIECDRCQGRGWYAIGTCNNELVPSRVDNAVCWKCHGARFVPSKWIERTPEYQAKLDARREAKQAVIREREETERKEREEQERIEAERQEAERKAEEERIKAEKAISQFVGTIGEKIETEVVYIGSPHFEIRDPFGRMETRYIHTFKDNNGNKIVWKTGCGIGNMEENQHIIIKATIKDHSEYKDEKQTSVIRLKVIGEM